METACAKVLHSLLWRGLWPLALVTSLAGGLFFSGCATPPPLAPPAAPPAHLIVINQTDYLWQIVVLRTNGVKAHDARLQPRATVSLTLAGGDYVIEQTALSENAATELTRKIPAQLDSGQTYRWRLVTLLSEPSAAADSK